MTNYIIVISKLTAETFKSMSDKITSSPGNVWRFPSLAYENGGGSFLICYFTLLLFIGKPMYYMELALGQFTQRGPVAIWKLCPLGQGVGIAQCIVSILVAIYYNVIMAYCLYYIFSSFTGTVPWSYCASEDNGW